MITQYFVLPDQEFENRFGYAYLGSAVRPVNETSPSEVLYISRTAYDNELENAERGAEFFDETEPGWWRKIDPKALVMANSDQCICGQLFKERARQMREALHLAAQEDPELNYPDWEGPQNGYQYFTENVFDEEEFEDPVDLGLESLHSYAILDVIWRDLIKERVDAESVS